MENSVHNNGGSSSYCRKKESFINQKKVQLLIVMKLFLILLVISLHVSAAALSQQITLSVKKAPLREVMQSIRKQTGYQFFIKSSSLKEAKPVTLALSVASLEDALKKIFEDQPLTYQIQNKIIIIEPKPASRLQKETSSIQQINLNGTVTDSIGRPLIGATIKLKEQKEKITVTNEHGKFLLKSVPDNGTIIASMIGFQTKEVKYNDATDLLIQLKPSNSLLDAVQIIGYGATTKRLSTGNIGSVKTEVISQQPITNPILSLQGRVSGLQIIQENSTPGSSVTVRIRGRNSIGANNNPLYIVDGVPFTSNAIERYKTVADGGSANGSPLNTISPNDIESIEILKDADATAIYGSRASNGVVLITTKKGKSGRTKLDVDFNSGIGQVSETAKPLNLNQYISLRKDAFKNSGVTPTPDNAPDLLTWSQNTDTKWIDYYLGNTIHRTNANMSLSGGDERLSYLLSGSILSQGTPQKTDSRYTRSNAHLSLNYVSENRKLKLSSSTFFSGDYNKLFGNGTLDFINISFTPNYPAYKADGAFNYNSSGRNPISDLGTYQKSHTYNLNSNLNLSYSPIQNLELKGSLGYNKLDNDQIFAYPMKYVNPLYFSSGYSNFASQHIISLIAEPQITYRLFISKSKFDFLIGSTIQRNLTVGKQLSISGYTNDELIESINYGTLTYKGGSTNEYKYISIFGRLSYNFDNKYIINATVRRDGSTRFGPNRQFGTFGSIGGAWIFSDEQGVKQLLPFLSFGKLKASWGTTGNDGIGDYGYLSFYNNSTNYGNQQTLIPTTIANSKYGWEINKKMEIGLDLGFLQDRILINSAWYRNRSGNQLVTYPIPSMTGFTGYVANLPALVENKGFELDLNTANIKRKNFSWNTSINLTIPKNKLVRFPGIESTSYANSYVVGKSLNIIQTYHFTGIDLTTGVPAVEDVNKDGNIVPISSYNNQGGDLIIAGQTDPKLFAGMNNSFTYKRITLDVFLQYVKQDGQNLFQYYYLSGSQTNVWDSYLPYWKSPGETSVLPKPTINPNLQNYNYSRSDVGVSDASYLRIKNIMLSYSFNQNSIKKMGLNNLRLYIQANNVYTFTKYKGYDPETQSSVLGSYSAIPPIRMVTFGVNLTF